MVVDSVFFVAIVFVVVAARVSPLPGCDDFVVVVVIGSR